MNKTGKRAAFHNLGCKVNEYETEAMRQILEDAGYRIVPFEDKADLYIVNTCAVTGVADRKSRQMLHKARQMNPSAIVAAAGCYAEEAKEKLLDDPAVDLVIGNNEKAQLLKILKDYEADTGNRDFVPGIVSAKTFDKLSIKSTPDRTRAFVKIQDGCNQFCSYCLIPYVRGRVRSRNPLSVTEEVRSLVKNGTREIVLSGIHISSYGLDFDHPGQNIQTPYASEEKTNEHLLALIRSVADIEGVRRIRLGSLEPGIITEQFAAELAGIPTLCPQFHLSMQSGCDATLKRMNRRYTKEEFALKCEILRRAFPYPAITTDIITGFPGETEKEFRETLQFVEAIHFSKTHIFKYSRRKGTAAYDMPDQVTDALKSARSRALMAIDRQNKQKYAEHLGLYTVEVLFEDMVTRAGITYWQGFTREYVPAIMASEKNLANEIRICKILDVTQDGDVLCAEER